MNPVLTEALAPKVEQFRSAKVCPVNITLRLCRDLGTKEGDRVLEPSAGWGGMADIIRGFTDDLVCVELNGEFAQACGKKHETYRDDFLRLSPEDFEPFDYVLMCPPAHSEDHIRHAMKFLKPGGKLVAVVQERNIDVGLWPTYEAYAERFTYNGEPIRCGEIWLTKA